MIDVLIAARIDELKELLATKMSGVLNRVQTERAKTLIDLLPENPNRPCHSCQIAKGAVVPSVQGFFSCREHLKNGL